MADLTEDVGDGEGVGRIAGNPLCVDNEARVGRKPVEAVEADSGRSLCVFDAEIETVATLDHDY